MQAAVLEGLLPFGLVQKVRGEMRVAKEQPVTSAGLCGAAFLNKGAKWCNTGARSDHNDVARAVGRQAEPLILFHENRQLFSFIQPGQKVRSYDQSCFTFVFVSEIGQGQMDRSEEHTSELQSIMRTSYAVFCLTKKKRTNIIRKET